MVKKVITRILITGLALGMGTQVLLGSVARDLFACMPCCQDNMDPALPKAPDSKNHCCVIAAPEATNQFTASPKIDPTRPEGAVSASLPVIASSHTASPSDRWTRLNFWHSPPDLNHSPEKLSVFRI